MSLADDAGKRGTTLHGGPHSRAGLLQRTTGRRMFVYPRRRPPGPVCHVRPSLRYCDPCPCPHLLSPGADGGAGEHFVETAAFHFLDPLSRSAPRLSDSGRLPRHPKAGRLAMGTASTTTGCGKAHCGLAAIVWRTVGMDGGSTDGGRRLCGWGPARRVRVWSAN